MKLRSLDAFVDLVGFSETVPMRWPWKPIVLVGLMGGATVLGGDHFRVKARLLPGAPAGANYRHSDLVSRGTYMAMLEREEVVEDLNFLRQLQNPPVSVPTAEQPTTTDREGLRTVPQRIIPVNPSPSRLQAAADEREIGPIAIPVAPKKQTFRKVFRSAARDVATTAEIRSAEAAPVRLDDIRLAAYSDGRVLFTGRIQDLPKTGTADSLVKERTDGCRVTIFVRGYGSTEVASTAVNPNGPMLFECKQTFWKSKGEDYAISLICPEDLRLCGSAYQELTHVQVEVETRRNR